ncbi:uncharacterized protein RHOBADRAFT_55107 [Rhodotorula graminis WP1]|uniref:Uncharacterized protein n=1 Tax=Rhodotorula graminis (strain WP1) TaxID=578459 RepID=A0A0P9F1A3_RHOGW|nr:uncharacterized protein RHOBADRAFT_55107 [Rhodotorula graminis WP1]KPV73350.1 hypothetical protein RHOBADRAFT_55107 [Rhodotorula graminis WP1]
MHSLVLALCAAACTLSALALPSSSSTSTSRRRRTESDPLAALFSSHGHWVDTRNASSTWMPSDDESTTFRRNEHRWLVDSDSDSNASTAAPLVRLSRNDILDCLAGETVTIWGDSTARVLYYGLINKLEPTAVTDKHANRVLSFAPPNDKGGDRNATFEFRWDPVLGSNSYSSFRPFLSTGRLRDVRAVLALAVRLRLARTALVLAEVERPVQSKDKGGWHPAHEVDRANEWLREEVVRWKANEGARARTRVIVGSVFNAMIANLSANTPDGLHYDLALAEEQADVLLTALCPSPLAASPPSSSDLGTTTAVVGHLDDAVCVACAARALGAAAAAALALGCAVWLVLTRKRPRRPARGGPPGEGYELVAGAAPGEGEGEGEGGEDRGRAARGGGAG